MKDIKIISATKDSYRFNTKIHNFIDYYESHDFANQPDIYGEIVTHNTRSLPEVYNRYINESNRNTILIFAHDDLLIEDLFLLKKLNEAMKSYDVVGLAGMKAPISIKEPCLWHLMGDRNNMSGAVAHFEKDSDNNRFVTNFGVTPARVILLDGCFIAINTEKILEKGLRFDENNPAKFHFYDLNFSLDANKLGLRLGTWPIFCTHSSHGLENMSEEFLKGQEYFIKKWT